MLRRAFGAALAVAVTSAAAQEALPLESWVRLPEPGGSVALPQPISYPAHRRRGLGAATVRKEVSNNAERLATALREQLADPRRNHEVRYVPGAPTWVGVRQHARAQLAQLRRLGLIEVEDSRARDLLESGREAALHTLIVDFPESPLGEVARRELAERAFERGSWAEAALLWREHRGPQPAIAGRLTDAHRGALRSAPRALATRWIHLYREPRVATLSVCLAEQAVVLSGSSLRAFERASGRPMWQAELPPGQLSASRDAVLHVAGGVFTGVNVHSGAVEWTLRLQRDTPLEVLRLTATPGGWVALVRELGELSLVGVDVRGGLLYRTSLWSAPPGRRSRVANWARERRRRRRPMPRRQEAVLSADDGQVLLVGHSLFVTAEGFVARAHAHTGELLWVRDRASGSPLPPKFVHPVQLGTDGRELWTSTATNVVHHLDPLNGSSLQPLQRSSQLVLACDPLLTARFSAGRLSVLNRRGDVLGELDPAQVVDVGAVSGRLLALPSSTGVSWVDWLEGGQGQLELPSVFPRHLLRGSGGDLLVWGPGGVALVGLGGRLSPPPLAALPEDTPARVAALDAHDWRLRRAAFEALRGAPDVDAGLALALGRTPESLRRDALQQVLDLRAVRAAWELLAPTASPQDLDRLAFSAHLDSPTLPTLIDRPRVADLHRALAALPPCPARSELLSRMIALSPELQSALIEVLEDVDAQRGKARAAADLFVSTIQHDGGETVRSCVIHDASTRALALFYSVALDLDASVRHALHADPNQWNAATHFARLHFHVAPQASADDRRDVERQLVETEVPDDR